MLADKKEDRGVYRRVPVRIMGAQHEPVQPYLIESKMQQLLTEFAAGYINSRLDMYLKFYRTNSI